ncbi:MAG: molybdenum cofactor sulfurase [Pseudomonadota bacterium]
MMDTFSAPADAQTSVPAQTLRGTISGLYKAEGKNFITSACERLPLTFDGIPGDVHAGTTRKSGGREPWYKRGTEMRNERQVSILSPNELAVIARRLSIPEVRPEWIGGNLLLSSIPDLTLLPPRTLLFFEGGVTIKIDGDNAPCRLSGRSIQGQYEGRDDIEMAFPKQAQNLRGLVGWVEKPGEIAVGEAFKARLPPQRLYHAS